LAQASASCLLATAHARGQLFSRRARKMIIGVKRPPVYDPEFHDHVKRYRMECEEEEAGIIPGCPSWASAEDVVAAALASTLEGGSASSFVSNMASNMAGLPVSSVDGHCRRSRGSMEDSPQEPAEKRLRVSCGAASVDSPRGGGSTSKETIRGWAEAIVKALHGCPSVDQAAQRCSWVLEEVEAEVRQSTLNEVERAPPPAAEEATDEQPPEDGPGSPQALQHTNRTLMRAVHHLAERCKRLEAGNKEVVELRQALERSQDAQRRLQHSNEVLQSHLRISLAECSDRPLPWGNVSH